MPLKQLADWIVDSFHSRRTTPVLVSPQHLVLREGFFVALVGELSRTLSDLAPGAETNAHRGLTPNGKTNRLPSTPRHIRFDWLVNQTYVARNFHIAKPPFAAGNNDAVRHPDANNYPQAPPPAFASIRSLTGHWFQQRSARRVNAALCRHTARQNHDTTASLELTSTIGRFDDGSTVETTPRIALIVGCCDNSAALPNWTFPIDVS